MRASVAADVRSGSLSSRNLVAEATAPFWQRAERRATQPWRRGTVRSGSGKVHWHLFLCYVVFPALLVAASNPFSMKSSASAALSPSGSPSLSARTDHVKTICSTLFRPRSTAVEITAVNTAEPAAQEHAIPPTMIVCRHGSERYQILVSNVTNEINAIARIPDVPSAGSPPASRRRRSHPLVSRKQASARARVYLTLLNSPVYEQAPFDIHLAPVRAGERPKWVLLYGDSGTGERLVATITLDGVDGRFLSYWDKYSASRPA